MKHGLNTALRAQDLSPLDHGQLEQVLGDKAEALDDWLKANDPDCDREQAHMTEGSRERAYWHHGYLTALRDTLIMLAEQKR